MRNKQLLVDGANITYWITVVLERMPKSLHPQTIILSKSDESTHLKASQEHQLPSGVINPSEIWSKKLDRLY